MNILVANDDGIDSKGIQALAHKMEELGEVTVVAPKYHQSGKGHAISLEDKVHIQKIAFSDSIEGYAVDGTPADCVSFALNGLIKKKFDLVITGINQGENTGNCTLSSGTCGSAAQGFIFSIPSIAVSLGFGESYNYEKPAEIALEVSKWFIRQPFNKDFFLSINVPNVPDEQIKGYRICPLGVIYTFHDNLQFTQNGNDIMADTSATRNRIISKFNHFDGDLDAFSQNYVTITPLSLDSTCYKAIGLLKPFVRQ